MEESSSTSEPREAGPVTVRPGERIYIFVKELHFSNTIYDTNEMLVQSDPAASILNEEIQMDIPVVDRSKYLMNIDVVY